MKHLQLMVRTRTEEDGSTHAAVVAQRLGGATYELTKEYPSEHEAVDAFAKALRVLTVEHEGR